MMFTEFDELAGQTFEHITNLMGEDAVWLASESQQVHGKVLYKNPTEAMQIGDAESYEYRPNTTTIEYYEGTFTGLKESVDAGKEEFVTVRDCKFIVESVGTKFDGNTYIANIEPHAD